MPATPRPTARLLAIAAVGATLAVASTAQASPYIGSYRGLTFSLSVTGADRAMYNIDITATQQTAAAAGHEQALYVDIQRCDLRRCANILHATEPLLAAEITISPNLNSAHLNTTLDGLIVKTDAATDLVTASPSGAGVNHPGADLYPLDTASGGPNLRSSVDEQNDGPIALGRRSCGTKPVSLFSFQSIDQVGEDKREAPRGSVHLPAALKAPARCQ